MKTNLPELLVFFVDWEWLCIVFILSSGIDARTPSVEVSQRLAGQISDIPSLYYSVNKMSFLDWFLTGNRNHTRYCPEWRYEHTWNFDPRPADTQLDSPFCNSAATTSKAFQNRFCLPRKTQTELPEFPPWNHLTPWCSNFPPQLKTDFEVNI